MATSEIMTTSASIKPRAKELFRTFFIGFFAFIFARAPVFGQPQEKSTASLIAFCSLGIPLICAGLWWSAPRAHAWSTLSVRSRYGANRRTEAWRMEFRRLVSAEALVLFFTWSLFLSIYESTSQLIADAQVSVPFLLLIVFAQAGLASASYAWAGRIGLSIGTLLSIGIGISVQPIGTIFPTDLSKLLLGATSQLEEAVTTPHAALALLLIGTTSYALSLFRVAP